jgi:hypothetical protein
MVDAKTTQPSFTAGELDPLLHGRKDLAKYQVGVKFSQNFQVIAQGGMMNRAGLRFVTAVKDSTKTTRLKLFEAADDEAFLLEAGDLYIRPIYQGAYLDAGGGVPVETVTPYAHTQVDELYFSQSNDVATLTHPEFAPREYSRTGPTTFVLSSAITFQPTIAAPTVPAAVGTNAYTGYGADVTPKKYKYKVAAVNADGEESLPSPEDESDIAVALGYDANFITITWSAVTGAVDYLVYKEQNGVYGLIGNTPNLTFKDNNIEPDFQNGPQSGANPFASTNNYPRISGYVQQRRCFAHTELNKQTVWMTQSGNFKNMGTSTPLKDDDAVEFTLAGVRKQDILHMLALDNGLLLFTRSGEWVVTGSDSDVITPSSIFPRPQSAYGTAADLKPLIVGDEVMFPTRLREKVLALGFSIQADKYKSVERTVMARHLFTDRHIVAWDYAAEPDGVIWCVMSDGELLSLTYLLDHEVWGWGRHHTAGKFKDVVVVPEAGRDVPYFLVQRRIGGVEKKYIEYLERRTFTDVKDCFFVDSGISLDAPVSITAVATGAATTLTSAAHGLADGDTVDLDDVGFIDNLGDTTHLKAGRYIVDNATTNTFDIVDDFFDPVDTSEFVGSAYDGNGVFREPFTALSGALHLAGRTVVVLADGNVVEDLVVSGTGTLTLPEPASRVHIGLAYQSYLVTLDVQNTQGDDTGLSKAVPTVWVRVDRTRGISIGETLEAAVEPPSREDEDYDDPASLKTGLIEMGLWGEWGETTQIAIVQTYPLPAAILGVTQDLAYGG